MSRPSFLRRELISCLVRSDPILLRKGTSVYGGSSTRRRSFSSPVVISRVQALVQNQWLYVQKDAEIKTNLKQRGHVVFERERLKIREQGELPAVIEYKFKARQLLNIQLYDVGSFRNEPEYKDAQLIFSKLLNEYKTYDKDTVQICFQLIRRLLEELRARPNIQQQTWICDPKFPLNEILIAWRRATLVGEHVYSSSELLETLHEFAAMNESFRIDESATEIIIFVIERLADVNEAPLLTQKTLNLYWGEHGLPETDKDKINRSLWNKLLFAWSKSNHPDALEELKRIFQFMNQNPKISTNLASYNIILKFYARRGMVDEVEETLGIMKKHVRIGYDVFALFEAVTAHLMTKNIDRAEELLDEMISEVNNNPLAANQSEFIPKVLRRIFVTYRELMEAGSTSKETKEKLYNRACALFRRVPNSVCLKNKQSDFIIGEMMSLAALAEKPEAVEELANSIQELTYHMWNTWIMALAAKTPDRATAVLDRMVKSSTQRPTISMINQLLESWAESERQDAFENAFQIFKQMNSDPDYEKLPFHPNVETYNILLKTLSRSRTIANPGRIAGLILDSMEECAIANDKGVKPNAESITYAVRCCLAIDDVVKAEQILERLVQSRTERLDASNPFLELLKYWAQKGTEVEKDMFRIVIRLREFLKVSAADTQSIVACYRGALDVFCKLRSPTLEKHLWMLYEKSLCDDDDDIDVPLCISLFEFFSLSANREALEKAEFLVQRMAQKGVPACADHYVALTHGWIRCNDPNSAARALERQLNAAQAGDNDQVTPKETDYTALIDSFLKDDDIIGASSFLYKMKQLCIENSWPSQPVRLACEKVLAHWKESSDKDKQLHMDKLETIIFEHSNVSS